MDRNESSGFDWSAIRAYYEVGHTRRECQARFGFSNGAWNRAVDRGGIVPRPRSSGARASGKREAVARLRAEGKTYVEIANELGLTKSTVAYHARRAGLPADERFSRRYDWRVVQSAIDDEGLSMRDCMRRFGFSRDAWGKAVKRGDLVPREWITPLDELLVAGPSEIAATSSVGLSVPVSRRSAVRTAASRSGLAGHSACSCTTGTATAKTTGWRTWSSYARTVIRRPRPMAGATDIAVRTSPSLRNPAKGLLRQPSAAL
jgi:hypothetical protein